MDKVLSNPLVPTQQHYKIERSNLSDQLKKTLFTLDMVKRIDPFFSVHENKDKFWKV